MLDFIRKGMSDAVASDLGASLAHRAGDADPRRVEALASALRPFLRVVPEALAFVIRAGKDPRVGRAIELASGQVVLYLLDEEDALPEAELGLLGMLDDALLVHSYAAQLLTFYPWLSEVAGGYELPPPATFELVRCLLPAGAAEAIERTSRTILTVSVALVGTRPEPRRTDEPPPELRIADALAALPV